MTTRTLLATLLTAIVAMSTYAQTNETATEAVKNMGVGWNLGNTLDANGAKESDPSNAAYWGCQGLESETYWGQTLTTSALMTMMKEAGFGAIRVPVTWYNHMDKTGKVDAKWMKRVHEVVDYVIDNGMYCILNVHHDTGADGNSKSWLKANETWYNNYKDKYKYLWQQIAEEFKDYDGKLLFESYNEMLDTNNSWCFASFAAPGNYNAAISTSAYNAINSYAQSFVDVVRATGSRNADRNLIVNTYAASNGYGTWSSHLIDPVKSMKLPQDAVANHLIFEVHSYPSISDKNSQGVVTNRPLSEIKKEIDGTISVLKANLMAKGAPVIIGEWGTSNVDAGDGKTDYDSRRDLMMQFVDYYVGKAKESGIAMFYWMGLTDGAYRAEPAFSQPDLAERIVKAYHGNEFKGTYPEPKKHTTITCFEGDKPVDWGNGITIPSHTFKSIGEGAQLELTYKLEITDYDDIQFFLGDWSKGITFKVDGKTINTDFKPRTYYNIPNGSEQTTVFTFDSSTYALLSQKGLIIHGRGFRIYKAVISDPSSTTEVKSIHSDTTDNATTYTLSGQPVNTFRKGVYIKNRKKLLAK